MELCEINSQYSTETRFSKTQHPGAYFCVLKTKKLYVPIVSIPLEYSTSNSNIANITNALISHSVTHANFTNTGTPLITHSMWILGCE